MSADSSSFSEITALDRTRNSISLLPSQDSTPKRNRDDEFLHGDTGSTNSATGSSKRGVGALNRGSVSHKDSGSLNGNTDFSNHGHVTKKNNWCILK